mmetsp:Transcript_64077/g.119105  ORF Transcript_64077/g.119105 Transcript_64077/m.119105 type:complete len:372 (-) Transcript_64077:101-1216(-)
MGRPPVWFLLVALGCSGYCFLESRSMARLPSRMLLNEPSLGSSATATRPSNTRRTMHQLKTHAGVQETEPSMFQSLVQVLNAGMLLGLMAAVFVSSAPYPVFADAPGKWNYLNTDTKWPAGFAACRGKEQSPIDIRTGTGTNVLYRGKPEPLAKYLDYEPTKGLQVFNNGGKNIQVNGGFGTFTLPDGVYEAKQFHVHFPSEHTINGKLFAGELHIVHQRRGASGTNGLAVVGLILDEGTAPVGSAGTDKLNFLYNLGFGLELPEEAGQKTNVQPVDLDKFMDEFQGGYFHYEGSLTTPPCSEKVHWYVLEQPVPCTVEMTKSFKALFPENNRPPQPLNRRRLVKSLVEVPGEFVEPGQQPPPGFRKLRAG